MKKVPPVLPDPRLVTPEQAAKFWEACVQVSMSDRARWAESLSDEELDAEMRAMGRDPAVERAKGLALAEKYLGPLKPKA